MSRIRIRRAVAVLAALVVGICASAECARAALAGHPSYSANLSVNKAIRQQQLICDPAGSVFSGSMSTLYQPGQVSFANIGAVPGFDTTDSYIEVKPFTTPTFVQPVKTNSNGNVLITTGGFIEGGGRNTFTETGYIQTFFQRPPGSVDPTVKNPDEGYDLLAEDGFRDPSTGKVEGDDTHYMFFDLAPGVPLDAPVYTNFADDGSRGFYPTGGPASDSITPLLASGGPGQPITVGIESATVPEPVGAALVAAFSLLLIRQRRRDARRA